MKNIRRFTLSLVTLLVISGLAMVSPAAAVMRPGPPGVFASDTVSDSGTIPDQSKNLAQQFKAQAQAKLQAERQTIKARTEAERQQACTARQKALTTRMSNAVRQAKKYESVIDTAYSRVKSFHDSKNLNVSDYATLTAAVDAAQANAKSSVEALQSLDVSVDCSSQTVADSVSAYQSAVKNTRDSLKAYRTALVDLINSLKGASTGASTQSTTNSTAQ